MKRTINRDILVNLIHSEIAHHKERELECKLRGESLAEMLHYGKSSGLNSLLDQLALITNYEYEHTLATLEKEQCEELVKQEIRSDRLQDEMKGN